MLRDDAKLWLDAKARTGNLSRLDENELWSLLGAGLRIATAILNADVVTEGGCPLCGSAFASGVSTATLWECGTNCFNRDVEQSATCKDRQINRLTAALAVDRERLMKQSAELNAVRQERNRYAERWAKACEELDRLDEVRWKQEDGE